MAKNKSLLLMLSLLAGFQLEAQVATNSLPLQQFLQLLAQLQKSPDDVALRGKIITLSLTIHPPPDVPDAATMAEGAAEYAINHAKDKSDYSDAAKEYEKALLLAPWIAADYYKCGSAHEKAEELKEAIRNFKCYLLASPDSEDAQEVKKRIGGLQYADEKKERKSDK